ncbi:phospholipase A and acyltransferase 4-like isoform X2 [Nerophis ophidion]|nr:phospholipase A and acyltransferase 4-like isoform X2 [Nerophis ophidion]XP_061756161.1 phospholipase A and acyltransferase 4-like isoform X2 [Nerophis ophidion]
MIEISRSGYQHWALYEGNGMVVHITIPSESEGAGLSGVMYLINKDTALVKREKLSTVVGSDRYRVNNSLDDKYQPCPVSVILTEAKNMVGQVMPYSVFSENCEHFVTNLRYGIPESRQVSQVRDALKDVAKGSAAIAATALFGLTGNNKDKRNQ